MTGCSPYITRLGRTVIARCGGWLHALLHTVTTACLLMIGHVGLAQGNENFENIPTSPNPSSYLNRSWTGTDGVTWSATLARVDQTLNTKAICTNGSGSVTSPAYAGGMGILQFNYVRAFTGTSARTIQVWVNGSQVGSDITVSPSSNTVVAYSATINVGGIVTLELRTSGAQIKIDDIQWTAFTAGPTVRFGAATSSALESAGTVAVSMAINPAAVAGTITITINGSSTATYGVGNDYTTSPAGPTTISVPVTAGATAVNFNVIINDDAITEGDETISFTITGVTAGLYIGTPATHVFTITDNDNTPTINFSTLNITVLENAGTQIFTLSFLPTAHPPGNMTIQMTNGPGATYGPLPNDDYTTTPTESTPGSGIFVLGFGPMTPTASFQVHVNDDLLPESTETVTFTIIAVSAGFAIGANITATLVIGDNDSPPAVLAPGDLAIVGVNANDNACDGGSPEDYDYVSFFCFQEITYGTELILTDNGYERCYPGQWGNVEGTVRMRRTGPAIPAGQVITFRIKGTGGPNVSSVAPDAGWSSTSIGIGGTNIALNVNGDQLFFMQGGVWSPGTTNGNNATYTGTLLYAFSTNPTYPWVASCSSTPNQRSNLPPGVECFSTSPTLASDFNKYTGLTTMASQRDWIIRLDNTANWNSYATCTDYYANGYNWLSAPILPINSTPMTHGLWRGAINTDWFECKNWDDARIPDAATDVVITENATRHCSVGLISGNQPGGTAVCASLTQITNNNVLRYLTVEANSTLTVGGLFRIQNTVGTGLLGTDVLANATLNAGTVELSGNTVGSSTARLRANATGSQVHVSGDLTIGIGGVLDLQSSISAFGTLRLGGDFTNLEDEFHFKDIYSSVILNGVVDQYILNSNPTELFGDLKVDKSGGDVYLTAPITIRNELDLTQGRIFSSPTELLTLNAGAAVVNASNAGFVHGPVKKFGNTDFTFPIGKNNTYRPASLSSISGAAGSAFTAEYFNEAMLPPLSLAHEPALHHVSDCEHWQIDRSGAWTPNAFVNLSWEDPVSCGVTLLADLRVAYWDDVAGLWMNRGNSATTGTPASGTVTSGTLQTSFTSAANYWTLASVSSENPLPIELLSFTAVPKNSKVDLRWSTASEQNNDHFTVERSADAMNFQALLQVPGAGNSQQIVNYADEDRQPLSGLSYYRLRQTDLDGTSEVSDAVPVFFSSSKGQPLQVLYGNNGLFVMHDFAPGSTLEVMDLTGRVVSSTGITGQGLMKLPLDRMAHGVYLIRLSDGVRTESTRVAY